MKKLLFLIIIFLISCSQAFCATYCVRPDVAVDAVNGVTYNGDGTTWAAAAGDGQVGAYKDLPDTLVRGDTYYLADGTYSGSGGYNAYLFNHEESGELYIYVKKATSLSHGTETGWSSGYGDGYAQFVGFILRDGYYNIDGNNSGNYGAGTYGIHIVTVAAEYRGIYLDNQTGDPDNHHVILKNIYIDHRATEQCGTIALHSEFRNVTIDDIHVYRTRCDGIHISSSSNIVQYSYIERKGEEVIGCDDHADALVVGAVSDSDIRYNKLLWNGQIVWFTGGASEASPNVNTNVRIYGNIISGDENTSGQGICVPGDNTSQWVNLTVYNNTFIDLATICIEASNSEVHSSTADIRNNLFYNVAAANLNEAYNTITHDYNAFQAGDLPAETNQQILSSDPFTNYSDDDDGTNDVLTLSSATSEGDNTIGSTYNTDMDGNTRGTDGTWDIGAYEYTASDTTPPVISSLLPSGARQCDAIYWPQTPLTLACNTDENSTCKYATSDVSYDTMGQTFSTTGTTVHSQSITFQCGTSYIYYVRCMDESSNKNTTSTSTSFILDNDPPPRRSYYIH